MSEKPLPLALVTGAAHRLGRAFALSLARQGYAIFLHHFRSTNMAAETADELRALGVPVFSGQADLTDSDSVLALFSKVDAFPHPLRVLVNSAAVMPRGDVRDLPVEDWDATLDLNLRAPFLMAQQAAKRMTRGGLIINVSDAGASKAWTGFPAYTISKAGLETLTRLLAKAYAPQIRVNAIAPGLALPSDTVTPEEWKKLVSRLPLRRPASLEDVSSTLEFLLKNESVTGQTLVVDSGYSLL